jgi:predicted NAD/FAD-dependent oxidoreductase
LHDGKTVLVIHASPTFSRENYGGAEDDVARKLLSRATEITGTDLSPPTDHFLQRWRYAQPVAAPRGNEACISFEEPAPLILAGECFAGGKIEGAWLSGRAAGRRAGER